MIMHRTIKAIDKDLATYVQRARTMRLYQANVTGTKVVRGVIDRLLLERIAAGKAKFLDEFKGTERPTSTKEDFDDV